jgi:Uma2 family endonuclease
MHEEPTMLLEPDDLLRMPEGDSFELVDGRAVEKPMGAESDRIALRLGGRMDSHCERTVSGYIFGSATGYRCYPDRPRLVRKPDASFVAKGRFPNEVVPKGDISIAPDLVVEVVSPNDLYEEIEPKVIEYIRAGIRMVWVISPTAKTVLVRRPNKTCTALDVNDTLSGEDVLPGFACSVAELFT